MTDSTTWCGFAREIVRLAGLTILVHPIPALAYPPAARRPTNLVLASAKLKRVFGFALPDWKRSAKRAILEFG